MVAVVVKGIRTMYFPKAEALVFISFHDRGNDYSFGFVITVVVTTQVPAGDSENRRNVGALAPK
jgi:hypothetical protein